MNVSYTVTEFTVGKMTAELALFSHLDRKSLGNGKVSISESLDLPIVPGLRHKHFAAIIQSQSKKLLRDRPKIYTPFRIDFNFSFWTFEHFLDVFAIISRHCLEILFDCVHFWSILG